MEGLINHLYQRVPIIDITVPSELDPSSLLPVLVEISQYNPYYIKTFLSHKLFTLADIDQDEFYELFSTLINARPKLATDSDLIRYNINGTIVKIRETPRLISGAGTTGLRTWEAALYLANYLHCTPGLLQNRSILELGTGTGLVGMSILKNEQVMNSLKEVVITDGDSNLIESLTHSLKENDIYPQDILNLRCTSLWWGRDKIPSRDVDLMIAADVTYDATVIPSLVKCLKQGFDSGANEALIAATIRNDDTIKVFENEVLKNGLKFEIVCRAKNPHLELANIHATYYPVATPEIRIYCIKP